jgi:hypothetical protein
VAPAQLRPLSVGEILDAAIKVYLRHWKPLTLAVIGPILPLTILSVLLTASLDSDDFGRFEETGDPADISTEFWVGAGLSSFVTFLTTAVVTAVCFKAVADAWLGAEPSVGRSWRFALPRVLALVGLFLLSALGYFVGLLACIVPGIFLYVMWSVSTATLLFERVGPFQALGRSFQLIKQRFWAVLALQVIVFLLTLFVGGIVQGIPTVFVTLFAEDNEIATAVSDIIFGTLGNAIVLPIGAAVITILYFDQRVRKEGFDVQVLAQGLGTAYDPDAPIPAPLRPEDHAAPAHPGWQPPAQQYGGGWNAPSHEAPPLRWGPAADPPRDARPPEGSPWVRPEPPGEGEGGWQPPAGASPDRRWDPREREPDREQDDRADWQPPEEPRGPGGL